MNKTVFVYTMFIPLLPLSTYGSPEAKLTVHVVDDHAQPVSGANVTLSFDQPKLKADQWGSSDVLTRAGKTDVLGFFSAAQEGSNHVVSHANAVGYYETRGRPVEFWQSEAGKWQPWNPTIELILKKVINPIPMYARRVNRSVPVQTRPVGFDMFAGDFVAPHGQGNTADLILLLEHEPQSKDHDKLVVNFSNAADGILPFEAEPYGQGSTLRSEYTAPVVGFLPSWTISNGRDSAAHSAAYNPHDHAYYLRVRTVADSSGKIVSAHYGKIYGDFMNFTYYLNPTPNDRNVEFDPKRNLFTNLKPDERVSAP